MPYIIWDHAEQLPHAFFPTMETAIAALPGPSIPSKRGNPSCDYENAQPSDAEGSNTFMEIFQCATAPAYFFDHNTIMPFTQEIELSFANRGFLYTLAFAEKSRLPFLVAVWDEEGCHFGNLEGFIFFSPVTIH